jgi:hypothetical protein
MSPGLPVAPLRLLVDEIVISQFKAIDYDCEERRVYPPWADEDMAKFEARWLRGTRERVIFDIIAYIGLRIGDVPSSAVNI